MALTKLKKIESTNITETLQPSQPIFSEFIRYKDFVFRVKDVDCFFHYQNEENGEPVTRIFLKGYCPYVIDQDKQLFSYLCSQLNPHPISDE